MLSVISCIYVISLYFFMVVFSVMLNHYSLFVSTLLLPGIAFYVLFYIVFRYIMLSGLDYLQ
jgi:hypothetical protein